MTNCPANLSIVEDTHIAITVLSPFTLCSQFTRTGRFANVNMGYMKQTLTCADGLIQNERDVSCNADCSVCNGTAEDNTKRRHIYTPSDGGQGLLSGPCWMANVTTGTPLAFGSMQVVRHATSHGDLAFIDAAFRPCDEVQPQLEGADVAALVPMIAAAVVTFGIIAGMLARSAYRGQKRQVGEIVSGEQL